MRQGENLSRDNGSEALTERLRDRLGVVPLPHWPREFFRVSNTIHRAADKLAGALVGAAIVAAIDDGDKHQHHRSYSGYSQPTYNPGSYSVRVGVICYPRREVCESVYGNYDAAWTYREFG